MKDRSVKAGFFIAIKTFQPPLMQGRLEGFVQYSSGRRSFVIAQGWLYMVFSSSLVV